MKSITLLSSVLFILAFSAACDEGPSQTKNPGNITNVESLCSKLRTGIIINEIDRVCAETSINAYEMYIDTVKSVLLSSGYDNNEDKLIRGANIDKDELIQVLMDLDSLKDELYIMLANKEDEIGVYTDFIFTIQSGEGAEATYTYFDFTRPCPTYCPDKYSEN